MASWFNEEPEELIRYAALIHNSVQSATESANDVIIWISRDMSELGDDGDVHRAMGKRHAL
jgi:hypothetical protein